MSNKTKEAKENKKQDSQPNAYLISKDLAVSLVRYLNEQPHGKVRDLIAGLERSRPILLSEDENEGDKDQKQELEEGK